MDSLIAIGSTAALVYGVFAIYRIGYGLGVGTMRWCPNITWIFISNRRR